MAGPTGSIAFAPRPEELAFHEAIVNNPGDDALWLILADWLEEHDDPQRAELLRLHRRLLETCCEPEPHPDRAGWQACLVELLAAGVRPSVPQRRVNLGGGVEMVFSWLPPGRFLMGSPPSDQEHGYNEQQHRVTLSRGFWLGATPVTQAQWKAVMNCNPSHFKGNDRPVEQVSWEDCQDFCREVPAWSGERYELPSEAEWEYACRAGTTTRFYVGDTLSTDQANYNGTDRYGQGIKGVYRQETTPVGSFPPNGWGLVDLHGNVREWCQDWYGPYPVCDLTDPHNDPSGSGRVLRGGSWHSTIWRCRAAIRDGGTPASRLQTVGFRVCARLG